MQLLELCNIQSGLTMRGRLAGVEDGGTPAIQLRDVPPSGRIGAQPIGRYKFDDVPTRYWASSGDLLFRSRGERNTAIMFDDIMAEPAVALLPLIILRPKPGLANARYIAWFINQQQTQRYFDKCARGTGIRMIPMDCLAHLTVDLPDQATQRIVGEIDELARREEELTVRLAEMKRTRISLGLIDRVQSLRRTRERDQEKRTKGEQT